MGAHIGFFTQAGFLIGSMDDDQTDNKPKTSLSAGNTVLQLEDNDLGKTIYEKSRAGNATTYSTSNEALWYAGYEKPEMFNAYLETWRTSATENLEKVSGPDLTENGAEVNLPAKSITTLYGDISG